MRKKVVRIKDIAEKAQVSAGTVDRVLHNRGLVSEEVRKKVVQIVREMNYKPNLIARTLKSNRTYKFAALIPDPDKDIYWNSPKSGIEKAESELNHYGVTVEQFIFDPYSIDSFLKKANEVAHSNPDGILLAPIFHKEVLPFFADWQARNIPYVLFNTQIPNSSPLSYIGQDSYQSGLLAAKLLQYGISEPATLLVAHISEDISNSAHLLEKEKGFRNFFSDNGLASQYNVIHQNFDNSDSSTLADQLTDIKERFSDLKGIFVTNSKAYELAYHLEKFNWGHIKLIGYDLLPQNLSFLKSGIIKFLINQNPLGQGYCGIYQLSDSIVFKKNISAIKYLPLDIVTQENLSYYLNTAAIER
ncbi:LacI family DNA-binding transcriptional regulator [Telluribacter sp. SYSU D00476]|uniref:LacI family DNA-binding transcriptional regulator n=1 Tax=Telluribacter sp. SYSU D00476 TaxID=2811430 RepID=UPI001FF5D23B|nr:LacI family DNA-binding transcriptional regulator [Telluribacter sp. SYSU D00476]